MPASNPRLYRGRFAPSPTGALHFGSLIAATASFLEARSRGGEWLLRMEDIDTARKVKGAASDILRTLEAFGFTWDGPVWVQSERLAVYQAALERLRQAGMLYGCNCSRSQIAATAKLRAVDGGWVYPGRCREAGLTDHGVAQRLRVSAQPLGFIDRIQGELRQHLATEVGDFILRRADGLFAYQLAVVVDDAAQGISDIVRGADLLASTPRQIWLQRCLGYSTPTYAHLPVATNPVGEKWSKQTCAPALDMGRAPQLLWQALDFLGQQPLAQLRKASLSELWSWALSHWSPEKIPRRPAINAAAHPD
ncbi:tRNA glutamyl-Q(34) synthetase GluQRS [Azonexus sp.]|uniref:tRNA glutamyl-Q(34) synthetase GluQRS n=1 Tax=Azonexus sp. TaxID=1872668 RepID=UPI0039E55FD8